MRGVLVLGVELWWSTLVAADHELLDVLDGTERARVETLSRPADKGRSMVGAALLRAAVGQRLGVPARDVVIDRRCAECTLPHGRPRILGPGDELPAVSVSHSGVLVVVALSEVPIGIDVQRVSDLRTGSAEADEAGARDWVAQESVRKLGSVDRPVMRWLQPPMRGYAAALAASDTTELQICAERQVDSDQLRELIRANARASQPAPRTPDRARRR